jgi:hypothetical protein
LRACSIIYAIGYTSPNAEKGKGRVYGYLIALLRKSCFIMHIIAAEQDPTPSNLVPIELCTDEIL